MSLYEFKESDAYDFARSQYIEVKPRGEELQFKVCPYCHGGKSRDKGTFHVNLRTGVFKCLRASCSQSGNMITLARDFDFRLSKDVDEYYLHKSQYKKLPTPKEPIRPKEEAIVYLEGRGISRQTIEKYEITTQTSNDNILVFPFYNEHGKLDYVKYRNINYNGTGNKEWCEADCKPILFGMKQCDPENKTLIITEGQIDSLSVAEAGFDNAVSVPSGKNCFTWVPHVWDWWQRFDEVIVFGDYENGSITLLDDLKTRFPGRIKHVRFTDYKGCKDANEILMKHGKAAVEAAIHNAVFLPVKRVKELAEVEKVDIYNLPKLKTGISSLDKLLGGGLFFGQVDIIGGKRGDGKSTFASQIIASALDQNIKTLVYSGELPDFLFKAWLDYQLAGPRNVIDGLSNDGEKAYYVSKTNLSKISEWYREKIYIYDQSIIVSDEADDLLKTIESAIMQYGIRLVLIDNLMTAIDLDARPNENRYDKQSSFVKRLAQMALKYNILILLVAHRRKNNGSLPDANDEISGAAEITNIAGVVLSYDRDKDLPQEQRKLIVSKSRLIGKLNFEGYILNYDEKSKRIYEDRESLDYSYGWEKDEAGFVYLEDKEKLPFDEE